MRVSFTVEQLEYLLLILVRVSAFVVTAPFFNLGSVPMRVKAGFSFFFALTLSYALPAGQLSYYGVIDFALLVVVEALAGLMLGFFTNIVLTILSFAGRIVDMEIGLAMVMELDPLTHMQSSITGNLYTYFVTLLLLASGFHRFLIHAFADTYQVVPVGGVSLDPGIYQIMVDFMRDYFLIAFRIVLPVYGTILLVNVVLGIMAKVAPQMNMFVVGIQMKIFFGLAILLLMVSMLPGVADFLIREMKTLFREVVGLLS